MKKFIIFTVIFAICMFYVFCPVLHVVAAPVVTAGEAMQVAEILDLLADTGLIDLNQEGMYFTPSIYLRMMSGFFETARIPVDEAAPWLARLFDLNNELFWSSDGGTILQEHNGELVPVVDSGDLWFTTAYMGESSYIPFNYSMQDAARGIDFASHTWASTYVLNGGKWQHPFEGTSYYMLPTINTGSSLLCLDQILGFEYNDGSTFCCTSFYLNDLTPVKDFTTIFTKSDNRPAALVAFRPSSFQMLFMTSSYNNFTNANGDFSPSSTGYYTPFSNPSWIDSDTGENVSVSSGDISYLFYYSDPVLMPQNIPGGNYAYNDDPNNGGSTTIVSPTGDIANLLDFITNGFIFTGTIQQTGDYNVSFDGHIDASVDVTHGGSLTINLYDENNKVWADEGKATDFGHGLSLDGNTFNSGLSWLFDTARAVPDTMLAFFPYVPAAVWGIMGSALVVIIFLGLWRTFKGG